MYFTQGHSTMTVVVRLYNLVVTCRSITFHKYYEGIDYFYHELILTCALSYLQTHFDATEVNKCYHKIVN